MKLDLNGAAFDALACDVQQCRACERMCSSQRVLSRSAGALDASIMFIGEAPGRLGADNSGIPFHGDKAGHNFEQFLSQVGLSRYGVFVTNAVQCNPRDPRGNNAPPIRKEVEACSMFLRRQIDLIQPSIVVTLGAIALFAASLIETHNLSLRTHVRTAHEWYGRTLIPLYHPGQRAIVHRSFANQLSDYQFVAERSVKRGQPREYFPSRNCDIYAIADLLIRELNPLSYFALHKLFYLCEVAAVKEFGARLTDAYIVRQKDGPYCTDLHLHKLRRALDAVRISGANGLTLILSPNVDLFARAAETNDALPRRVTDLVTRVARRYGTLDNAKLKSVVYLTSPMRRLLKLERVSGTNTYNAPIDFGVSNQGQSQSPAKGLARSKS